MNKKAAVITTVTFWVIVAVLVGAVLFFVMGSFSEQIINGLEKIGLFKPEKKPPAEIDIEKYRKLSRRILQGENIEFAVSFEGEIGVSWSLDENFDLTKTYSTRTLKESLEEITVMPEHITTDQEEEEDLQDIDQIEVWMVIIPELEIVNYHEENIKPGQYITIKRPKINEDGGIMKDLEGNPVEVDVVLVEFLGVEGRTIRYKIVPGAEV